MRLPRRFLIRAGAVVAAAVLAAVTVLVVEDRTDPAAAQGRFSGYADDDHAASGWRQLVEDEGYDTQSVLSTPRILSEFDDAGRTAWVVLGMETVYGAQERAALHAFLERGGSLLISDTSGLANPLLVNESVQFGPSRVLDERFEGNLSFIAAQGTVGASDFPLLLNNPVSLLPGDTFDGDILIESSDSSYIDVNANQDVDAADVPGPFPLGAMWQTDAGGRIVLIADVGIFLNAGMANPDYNHEGFHRALLAKLLPEGGEVLVDESVHSQQPYVEAFADASRGAVQVSHDPRTIAVVGLLAAGLAIVPVAVASKHAWRRHEPTIQHRPLRVGAETSHATLRHLALHRLADRLSRSAESVGQATENELTRHGADPLLAKMATRPAELTEDDLKRINQRIENESKEI